MIDNILGKAKLFMGEFEGKDKDSELDDIEIIEDTEEVYFSKTKKEENIVEDKNSQIKKEIISWVKMLIAAVCIALAINFLVLFNGTVPSGSMKPVISEGSRIIGFRLSYLFDDPQRGDIIIFKFPDNPSENFVKRLIGLPGETVEIIDGKVYISKDGEMLEDPLEEPYLNEIPIGSFGPYEVPEDSYFMLGDNRNDSKDSRYWVNTFVPESNILAKALVEYWPEISVLK